MRETFPAVGVWSGITIVPEHIWRDVEDPVTFKFDPPIGTGPYLLESATESAFSYTRRDDWWGTEVFGVTPAPAKVNFMHVGPETSGRCSVRQRSTLLPSAFAGALRRSRSEPQIKA